MYVFNSLSTMFLLFGVVGFGTFVPKYFEYHFRKPASSSGKLFILLLLKYVGNSFISQYSMNANIQWMWKLGEIQTHFLDFFDAFLAVNSKSKSNFWKLLTIKKQLVANVLLWFPYIARLGCVSRWIIRQFQEILVAWQKLFLLLLAFFFLESSSQSKWQGG